tara:strand:- start:434 stop:730 length:297 start_codon:yes stop_codon:yes gene_type:complete
MKRILLLLLILLYLPHNAFANDREIAEQVITEAKKSYKKAVKLNNVWRDTKKILKKADKAHKDKDYVKATSLAKKALHQANMAIEQHNSQKDNYRFLD